VTCQQFIEVMKAVSCKDQNLNRCAILVDHSIQSNFVFTRVCQHRQAFSSTLTPTLTLWLILTCIPSYMHTLSHLHPIIYAVAHSHSLIDSYAVTLAVTGSAGWTLHCSDAYTITSELKCGHTCHHTSRF
jgi:hypothetical protein